MNLAAEMGECFGLGVEQVAVGLVLDADVSLEEPMD